MNHQLPATVRASLPEDSIEVRAVRKSPAAGAGMWSRTGRPRHQTVSRLRPFARRRFSVSRPLRVRIRARNPWVLDRLRFFG
jgi:hypothetical protein